MKLAVEGIAKNVESTDSKAANPSCEQRQLLETLNGGQFRFSFINLLSFFFLIFLLCLITHVYHNVRMSKICLGFLCRFADCS